jgi:hypothetical protein
MTVYEPSSRDRKDQINPPRRRAYPPSCSTGQSVRPALADTTVASDEDLLPPSHHRRFRPPGHRARNPEAVSNVTYQRAAALERDPRPRRRRVPPFVTGHCRSRSSNSGDLQGLRGAGFRTSRNPLGVHGIAPRRLGLGGGGRRLGTRAQQFFPGVGPPRTRCSTTGETAPDLVLHVWSPESARGLLAKGRCTPCSPTTATLTDKADRRAGWSIPSSSISRATGSSATRSARGAQRPPVGASASS